MFSRLFKTILIMAGVPVLLIACGEMGTAFPASGTYRVNALIGKVSLDECSIITEKDTIRPFFINSVTNDPDITGLMVFLQSPEGEIAGKRVQYTLKAVDTGAVPGDGTESGGAADTAIDKKDEPADLTADEEDESESDEFTFKPADSEPPVSFFFAAEEKQDITLTDTLIHVSRLDQELPLFPLPENLSIGRYTLVFQVLGQKEVLDRIERSVYYIGDAEFTLDEIQSYPPGVSVGSHLVPPGLTIMLETQVSAGEELDPYIVWYNGKKRIYEGSIAAGAGRFLWKAPDQTGFHTLRAEAFPFKPAPNLKGTIKELSLPVSKKYEHTGAFAKKADQFSNWYQFAGDLRDTKAPAETNNARVGQNNGSNRWLPADGIYGLAIGPNSTYQLPHAPYTHAQDERVDGQFLLRFKPVSGGTVFSALFNGEDSSSVTLDLSLSTGEGGLNLGLNVGGKSISIPISTGILTELRSSAEPEVRSSPLKPSTELQSGKNSPLEQTTGLQSSKSAPLEQTTELQSSKSSSLEHSTGLQSSKSAPLEQSTGLQSSKSAPLESLENEAFITAVIDFSFEADLFTAVLSLENSGGISPEPVSIPLSAALSGKGTFRLGGSPKPSRDETVTAIFDEFAALYRVTVIVKEEVIIENAADAADDATPVEEPQINPIDKQALEAKPRLPAEKPAADSGKSA
jgi:hypothetical protein